MAEYEGDQIMETKHLMESLLSFDKPVSKNAGIFPLLPEQWSLCQQPVTVYV